MSRVSRFLTLLLALAVAAWALLFCLANPVFVPLDVVLLRLPAAPLAVWVLAAFVLGGICGLLASSAALWRARRP